MTAVDLPLLLYELTNIGRQHQQFFTVVCFYVKFYLLAKRKNVVYNSISCWRLGDGVNCPVYRIWFTVGGLIGGCQRDARDGLRYSVGGFDDTRFTDLSRGVIGSGLMPRFSGQGHPA